MVHRIDIRVYKDIVYRICDSEHNMIWNVFICNKLYKGKAASYLLAVRQAKDKIDECLREGISSTGT